MFSGINAACLTGAGGTAARPVLAISVPLCLQPAAARVADTDVTRVTHAAVTNRGTHFPHQPLSHRRLTSLDHGLLRIAGGLGWPCIGLPPASPWQPCDFASLPDLPWPLFLAMTHQLGGHCPPLPSPGIQFRLLLMSSTKPPHLFFIPIPVHF